MIPTVSIGLPVFNGEAYLKRALDSLLSQDFDAFELIISDNASTDGTEAICREYARRDRRIAYHRNTSNLGATANYRRAFTLSRARFFKWASHDDECHPSLLRECLAVLESTPSAVLAYGQCDIIDDEGRTIERSPDIVPARSRPHARLASLMFHARYAHPLWGLLRSDALRRTRLMGRIEADHILLAELALLGDIVEIPCVLQRMRRRRDAAMHRYTARELLLWHDPGAGSPRILLAHWMRVQAQYLKAVRHIHLPPAERLLCYATVPAVPLWRALLRRSGTARQQLGLYRHRQFLAGQHVTSGDLNIDRQ